MSSRASTSSAATCGVSLIGSHVVHTLLARRAPSATSQSTEQVRPTANSSRSRYCRFSRRSSSSGSQRSSSSGSVTGRNAGSPVRRHGQLRLVQPGVHRDLPRRLPVVAQRDLDQPAVALGVVVPVDAQHDLVLERDLRRRGLAEIGDRDPLGDLDRGPLVPADPRLVALRRGHGLVHAPRRGHGERLQVVGDLAAQPHRRGDHQPALLRRVLQAGVLVGPRAAVVNLGQRNAPAGFGVVRVPDVGVGLARVRVLRDRRCRPSA